MIFIILVKCTFGATEKSNSRFKNHLFPIAEKFWKDI